MPAITKEQWDDVARQLSGPFGRVELKADGYEIVARVEGSGPLRQVIVVYVNGFCKGEWVKGGCPEAEKFCQAQRRWVFSKKARDDAAKKLKSRTTPKFLREHYERVTNLIVTTWAPYWNSPQSFVRHLRKTCADIEIVSFGYQG